MSSIDDCVQQWISKNKPQRLLIPTPLHNYWTPLASQVKELDDRGDVHNIITPPDHLFWSSIPPCPRIISTRTAQTGDMVACLMTGWLIGPTHLRQCALASRMAPFHWRSVTRVPHQVLSSCRIRHSQLGTCPRRYFTSLTAPPPQCNNNRPNPSRRTCACL